MVGTCYRNEKNYPEARAALGRAVSAARLPWDATPLKEVLRAIALWEAEAGNYSKAIEAYFTLARQYPEETPVAQLQIALCQHHVGNYPESERNLRVVLRKYPEHVASKDAYWWLAEALRKQARFEEALAVLDDLHDYPDRAAAALSFKAEIVLEDLKDIDAAITLHKQFIAEFRGHPWISESQEALVTLLKSAGRDAEAEALLAAEADPGG